MSTGLSRQEKHGAIAVPPRAASRMLSISLSKTYELLRNGELDSYSDGKARRVIVASIYAYIERRLAAGAGVWRTWQHARSPRRRKERV
jgi:excisionase family DNA binding protein